MFETETLKPEEPKRNNLVVGVLALVVIGLIVAVLLIASSKPENKPALPNGVRAGNAEFENYKSKVTLDIVDRIVHPNMIGMAQYEIQTRITNRGDRALTGIEIAGRMIDMNDQLIKRKLQCADSARAHSAITTRRIFSRQRQD